MAQGAQRQRRLTRFDNLEAATAAIDAGTFAGTSTLNAASTLGGTAFDQASAPAVAGAVGTFTSKHALPFAWEVAFASEVVSVVDSGGAAGGFATPVLLTLPPIYYQLTTAYMQISVESVGGGISATGDVSFGMGTGATSDASLASTEVDHAVVNTITLTGGAGAGTVTSAIVSAYFNNLADAIGDLYLNIGVPDADISATADVTFSGRIAIFGFELS